MDYGIITGSGAEKLESSGVAPLVAVAHGFTTVLPDQVKEVCDSLQFAPNSIPARQVRGAVGDRDAMLMRWFTPADAIEQATADYPVAARSVQIRPHPANVRTDASGKSRKYENIQGQNLVIGVHPATPASWLMEPIEHLLIAEGAMKADSALTAYLRHHGATDKELSVTDKDDRMTAIERLRKLMERIPESERMVIMSVVGVGTWHKNPEWNTFRISGEVLISYDGDVGTNPQVWKQAREMFDFIKNKGGQPMLVDLSDHEMEDGSKCGVDDFLAMGNTWEDLLATVGEANTLPERPEGADGDAKYRMNPKTRCFEEKISHKDDSGNEWVEWIPKVNLTARVVEVVERREVTAEEEESGNYAETVSAKDVDSDCIIEVEWRENDKEHVSRIEGPATLMATRPERWTDPRLDVGLGADVLGLPQWPPTVNGFLEAMKSYRRDEIEHTAAWTHMGWVPRKDSGTPVFLIGNQVISHDGFDSEAATCGVTESDLAGASNFGVDLPDSDEQVREDIQKMVDVYRACWSDPRNFAVVIAAAMRPAIPRPANVPLFYSGSSGSGKALPLDSSVITPEGTKKVGDLQVGDHLIAPDGTPTRLRWLSPVFEDEEIYELELSDGQTHLMSGNHVLRVSDKGSRARDVSRENSKRMDRARTLRKLGDSMQGGDANSITMIAEYLAPIGVKWQTINNVVAKAGVPSEVRPVLHGGRSGEYTEVADGFRIQRLGGLDGDGGIPTRLFPVPEVLYALADHYEYGLNLVDRPPVYSSKVSEVFEDYTEKGYAIPVFDGLNLPDAELPIAPYTLGAWLGDGVGFYGKIVLFEDEIADEIRADGYEIHRVPSSEGTCNIEGLHRQLRVAGLKGNKHIPMTYLRGSREQRLALLQGIMDTDGSIDANGNCKLSLSDERLANDTLELIRGLGIKASVTVSPSSYVNDDGDRVWCKDRHRIHFTTAEPVFRVKRKAERLPQTTRRTQNWLYIRSVRKVETVPSRCVQVEHPTGCFMSEGYVQTHNSFTSAAIMAFWQPTPGRWSDKHLPGSASDTLSATEIALSKTPIWVLDDLAPSSANPRAQAEKTEAVNQTIRNVHNGAGKRRATKDMGSQKTNTPRALLVVSAEAAPINDQSIMNRLVHVEVAPGFLVPEREPTDRLENMNRSDTVASRITGRAIQMLARKMAEKGWRDTRSYWNDIFNDMSEDAHAYINDQRPDAASSAKRQSETIAEMLLGVQLFGDLCDDLGMDMQDTVGEMVEGLKSLALEGFSENLRFDLGNQFLSDIRMLLISQQVHVAALGTGGAPITVGEGGVENNSAANALNQFLGWKITGDPDRPYEARGDVIGYLVHTKNDDPVVLLTDAAFHIVQRKGTNRGGLNQKAAFEAMWKARIPVPEDEGWKRKPRSGDKLDYRVRVMNNGTAYAGVPVYLSKLMES